METKTTQENSDGSAGLAAAKGSPILRRWAILFLSYERVMGLAYSPHPANTHFCLRHITLPPDARVVSVHTNHSRFGFDFVVESIHYEPVPNGVEAPRYIADITETVVERKPSENAKVSDHAGIERGA